MADGVAITAGSGTTICTDDTGATGHAQVMKLAISTDASPTLIPADAGNGLDVDVTRVPTDPFGANADAASASGSISAKLRQIATNGVPVTSLPALVAGTAYAGKVRLTDGTNDTSVSTSGALYVGGSVAHDAGDSGNPLKVGARAIAGISTISAAVSATDRTDLLAGTDGVLIVRPHCGLEDIVTGRATDTGGSSFAVISAGGAGVKRYLTQVSLVNTSTTAIYVDILDGASIKASIPVPAQGGAVVNFPVPIPGTANTAWNCDGSSAVTTLICSMVAFSSKV
jgi:hypothetical protein